jgi:hypothetical protein
LPKTIHAVTDIGFLSKLAAFFWAYTFEKLDKLKLAT